MIFSFLMVAILWAGYCLGEWAGFIVAIVICIIGGMQLYKYYKEKAELQEQERIKAEKEKLAFMQLQETQRIFSDSYHIVTTTTNIDTFHSRYDLLLEKSDELQKRINALSPYNDLRKNIQKELEEVRKILPEAKERVLRESFNKTVLDAEMLKTKNGKLNRYKKYLELLSKHSDFFSDTSEYDVVHGEIQANIEELENNSNSSPKTERADTQNTVFEEDQNTKTVITDEYDKRLKALIDSAECNLKNKDYGLYRNDLLAQATVYHDAGDLNTELELLFQVCFIDYYGYGNSGTQSMSDSMFAPAVLWRVKHSPVYEQLGDRAEKFYFQSIRKLPSDFTQKSRPHYSFIKVAEAVAEYKDYNER